MVSSSIIRFSLAVLAVLLSSFSAEVVWGAGIRMESSPKEIQAGLPIELNFIPDGEFEGGATMEIMITTPEEDAPLFIGEFGVRGGQQSLIYNFQDAGPHVIRITVKDPEAANAILSEDFAVEVAEAPAPRSAWLRAWFVLMFVLVVGVAIGIASARFRSRSNR